MKAQTDKIQTACVPNRFNMSNKYGIVLSNITKKDSTAQDRTAQLSAAQDSTGWDRTGEDRTRQERTGQDSTAQDRAGVDRTGCFISYLRFCGVGFRSVLLIVVYAQNLILVFFECV